MTETRRGYTRAIPRLPDMAGPYRPLHAYLHGRFADTVVLTFGEIEDLLGFALPDMARACADWWTGEVLDAADSPQSGAWIRAGRSARPNLFARKVVFDRVTADGVR